MRPAAVLCVPPGQNKAGPVDRDEAEFPQRDVVAPQIAEAALAAKPETAPSNLDSSGRTVTKFKPRRNVCPPHDCLRPSLSLPNALAVRRPFVYLCPPDAK